MLYPCGSKVADPAARTGRNHLRQAVCASECRRRAPRNPHSCLHLARVAHQAHRGQAATASTTATVAKAKPAASLRLLAPVPSLRYRAAVPKPSAAFASVFPMALATHGSFGGAGGLAGAGRGVLGAGGLAVPRGALRWRGLGAFPGWRCFGDRDAVTVRERGLPGRLAISGHTFASPRRGRRGRTGILTCRLSRCGKRAHPDVSFATRTRRAFASRSGHAHGGLP